MHGPAPRSYDIERHGEPLVFLEDEYGGQSIIKIDDGCFVLMNHGGSGEWHTVHHWYPEAALALRDYLNNLEMEDLVD